MKEPCSSQWTIYLYVWESEVSTCSGSSEIVAKMKRCTEESCPLVAKVLIILSFPSKDDSANSTNPLASVTQQMNPQKSILVEGCSAQFLLTCSRFNIWLGRVSIQEEIHECTMSATAMHVFVSRNFNLHKLGNFLWCTIIGRHCLLGGRLSWRKLLLMKS